MENKYKILALALTLSILLPTVIYANSTLFFGNNSIGAYSIEDWWHIACLYKAPETGTVTSITVYAGDGGTRFNVAIYDNSLTTVLAYNTEEASIVHNDFNTKPISMDMIEGISYYLVASTNGYPEGWRYDTGSSEQTKLWRSLTPEYKNNPQIQYVEDWSFSIYASYESATPEPTPVHDVALISVTASPTEVIVGETVTITVVVENQGTEIETFDVTTYYDSVPIDTKTVANLAAVSTETLTFSWDTTDVTEETYTISSEADTLPGETDTQDNTIIDGTVNVLPEPPPEPPTSIMVFTFDDGWESFMTGADILEEYGWEGTFAVTTNFIGSGSEYLTWNQVRELENRGHEIASHTTSHWYDKPTYSSWSNIEHELLLSRNTIRAQGLTCDYYVGADTWRQGALTVDEDLLHSMVPNYYVGSCSGDRMGRNVPWGEGLVRLMESDWEMGLTDLGRIYNIPRIAMSDDEVNAVGYSGLVDFVETVKNSEKLCVIYGHQVLYTNDPNYLRPSMSITPDNMRDLCDLIRDSGIQVMTLGEYLSPYISGNGEEPPTDVYADDFNDNSIDLSQHSAFTWGTASIEETGGMLKVSSGSNTVHDAGAGIVSSQAFDFTDGFIQVDGGGWCDVALNLMISPTGLNPNQCDEYYKIYYNGAGHWTISEKRSGQTISQIYEVNDYDWSGTHTIMISGGTIRFYRNNGLRFSCPYQLSSTTVYIYMFGTAWHGDQERQFDNLISNLEY